MSAEPGPQPPVAGVIGWPVAHSKSPRIHRFWLEKLGLDGDYSRFPVSPDRLADFVAAIPAMGLRGVNVTLPHKVAVLPLLDSIDPIAARIGAVNTIVVRNGRLAGTNTDAAGFMEPLRALLAGLPDPAATHAEIIGTGGAARAIAHGWGGPCTIYGRDVAAAERLAAGVGVGDRQGFAPLAALLAPATPGVPGGRRCIVVNATTLGMAGNPALAIDLGRYPADTIVYDIVYAPLETPLLRAARDRGLATIDGLAMLIGQAAVAFELLFGAPAPRCHDAELRSRLQA